MTMERALRFHRTDPAPDVFNKAATDRNLLPKPITFAMDKPMTGFLKRRKIYRKRRVDRRSEQIFLDNLREGAIKDDTSVAHKVS